MATASTHRHAASETAEPLRFEVRHSALGKVGAIAAPLAELGLFGMLVSAGAIAPESALLLVAPLWGMSLGHSWFIFGSHYELSETALRLVNGPWRREVALTDVLRARAIRTLDRGPVVEVNIAYGRRMLLSPVDREALIEGLRPGPPVERSGLHQARRIPAETSSTSP